MIIATSMAHSVAVAKNILCGFTDVHAANTIEKTTADTSIMRIDAT